MRLVSAAWDGAVLIGGIILLVLGAAAVGLAVAYFILGSDEKGVDG